MLDAPTGTGATREYVEECASGGECDIICWPSGTGWSKIGKIDGSQDQCRADTAGSSPYFWQLE